MEEFAKGDGPRLDKILRELDASKPDSSYINGPWTDMYLKDRRPVVFNTSGGLSMTPPPRPGEDIATTAARLLISTLR